MSKTKILDWFTVNSESLDVDKILFVLCVSLLLGAIIFITYRLAYTGVNYNSRFNAGNVVIVLITSVIMLMISSNMAISLGMVGALSIVRYQQPYSRHILYEGRYFHNVCVLNISV